MAGCLPAVQSSPLPGFLILPEVVTDGRGSRFINIIGHHQFVQLGLITDESSGLTAAEDTAIYYKTDGQPLSRPRHESTT